MIRWFDIKDYQNRFRTLNIFIGARGVGKTYSALSYCVESGQKFIYLRNTDVQIQECCTVFGNPFKRWAEDHGRDIYIKKEGRHANIYERVADDDVRLLGYACALSTFENLRGVDLSDVRLVLYDEFIEANPCRFRQFDTFSNFYETVNRNRELLGEEPLRVFLLSNAQKLDNDILRGYGLISDLENMIRSGQLQMSKRGIYLCLCQSEVSDLKKDTDIYAAAAGSSFYDQAIRNEFSNDNFMGIKKQPLNEYRPYARFDDLYIYRHKSEWKYYITYTRAENVPAYDSKNPYIFLRFVAPDLAAAYAESKLLFENFTAKSAIIDFII